MDLRLTGRRAVVTGASAGIGRAIATALALEGCDVVMVARREAVLLEAAREASALGATRTPRTAVVDLTDASSTAQGFAKAIDELGGLDILVNCVAAPLWGSFVTHDDASWEEVWRTKFLSYTRTSRLAIPSLTASDHGVILNIIGVGGKVAVKEHLAGGSVNAALMLLTAGMAKELAESRIRVVAINPGVVQTQRMQRMAEHVAQLDSSSQDPRSEAVESTPTGTIVLPTDVADLATFLVSRRARQVNGTTVTIDGGAMAAV